MVVVAFMENVLLQLAEQRHMSEDIHSLLRQQQVSDEEEVLQQRIETVEQLEHLSMRIVIDNEYRIKLVSNVTSSDINHSSHITRRLKVK